MTYVWRFTIKGGINLFPGKVEWQFVIPKYINKNQSLAFFKVSEII